MHGIVAWGVRAKAADSETRIERKARLRCSPRLIQLIEVRQDSRQIEMRNVISVGLKAPATLYDGCVRNNHCGGASEH
jgi:hypothetical protein